MYYHGKGGTDYSWERKMTELVSHIMEYVAAKRDMTDLYPFLLPLYYINITVLMLTRDVL